MAFDKAEWHYEGDWPEGLPQEQAYVHIGLYLGWLIERGLQSTLLDEMFPHLEAAYRKGKITGPQLCAAACDGVLSEIDMNDQGTAFTEDFYSQYLNEFSDVIETGETPYGAKDTRENQAKINTYLNEKFDQWNKTSGISPGTIGGGTLQAEQIIELVAKKSGHPKSEVEATYKAFIDILCESIKKGERVTVEGFGTFERRLAAHRTIKVHGSEELIPKSEVAYPGFSAAVVFKKKVDEPQDVGV